MSSSTTEFLEAAAADRVRQIDPFGVEVHFDLSRPLDAQEIEAFRTLFHRETLLLFRDQQLTMDEQIRVVEYIGPVIPGFGAGYLTPEDEVVGSNRLDYHSDMEPMPVPMDAISLLAIDLDETAASWTGFASGLRAYREIPDELRQRIADIEIRFVNTLADNSKQSYDIPPDTYSLVRPCVINHWVTGEPQIYMSKSQASRVEGLGRDESNAFLDEIFSWVYAPDNELRHVWRERDFVIWDNIALQHCRPPLDPGARRRMQRVGAGRKTLREQMPDWNLGGFFGEA